MKVGHAKQIARDDVHIRILELQKEAARCKRKRQKIFEESEKGVCTTSAAQQLWQLHSDRLKDVSKELKYLTTQFQMLAQKQSIDDYHFEDFCTKVGPTYLSCEWRRFEWTQHYAYNNDAMFRVCVPVRQLFKANKTVTRRNRPLKKHSGRTQKLIEKHVQPEWKKIDLPERPSYNWIGKLSPLLSRYIWDCTVDPEECVDRISMEELYKRFKNIAKEHKSISIDYSNDGRTFIYGMGILDSKSDNPVLKMVVGPTSRKEVQCIRFSESMGIIKARVTGRKDMFFGGALFDRDMRYFELIGRESSTVAKKPEYYERGAWYWLQDCDMHTILKRSRVDKFSKVERRGSEGNFIALV